MSKKHHLNMSESISYYKDINKYDIIIIGAGLSGIVAAKTYLQALPTARLLLLDAQAAIGGTWAPQRLYKGLQSQDPIPAYQFSDLEMDPAGMEDPEEGYIPGWKISEYLRNYADLFGLVGRTKCKRKVVDVRRVGDGWGIEVEVLGEGGRESYWCEKVMVASGMTSEPRNIRFKGQEGFEESGGRVFHGKYIPQNMSFLEEERVRNVVVVGSGKYSVDMISLLVRMGKKVDWFIRPSASSNTTPTEKVGEEDGKVVGCGRGPPALMPQFTDKGKNKIRTVMKRETGRMYPNMYEMKGWSYWTFHSGWFWPGSFLVRQFWKMVGRMMDTTAREIGGLENMKVELMNGSALFVTNAMIVQDENMLEFLADKSKVNIHRANIESLSSDGTIRFYINDASGNSKLTTIPSQAIICATGWRNNYSFFNSTDLKVELGLPILESSLSPELREHWDKVDNEGMKRLLYKLPMLAEAPPYPPSGDPERQETPFRHYLNIAPVSHLSPSHVSKRNIVFVGSAQTIQQTLTSEVQALWATAYLLHNSTTLPNAKKYLIKLPRSLEEAEAQVALQRAFMEKRYPGRGLERTTLSWDYLGYVDTLMEGVGLKPNWKSGARGFHSTRDYRGFVKEWLELCGVKMEANSGGTGGNGVHGGG